jgi:hypothetical protein
MNSKIKWVKNSRIKKYPKICSSNILDKESDAKEDDVVVSMINVSGKHPTINVKFSRSREGKQRREKNTEGKWITKSWTDCPNTIASINIEEGYIHFNRSKIKQSELRLLMDVVDTVCENRPHNMIVETI